MGNWYISEGGIIRGPITSEQIVDLVRDAQASRVALVWRRGMPAWQPASAYFEQFLEETECAASVTASLSESMPALPATPPASDRGRRTQGGSLILSSVVVIGMMAVQGITLQESVYDWPRMIALAAWWVPLFVGGAGGIVLVRGLWRMAEQRDFATAGSGGVFRLGSVLTGVVLLAGGAVAAPLSYLRTDILFERARFANYSLVRDGTSVRMMGPIGPGFASRLQKELEVVGPGPKTLIITSKGGLIGEALRAARSLADDDVTTIARAECDSACVVVLMGGWRRYTDLDVKLGMHGASAVQRNPWELIEIGVRQQDQEVAEFLVARGLPADLVEKSRAFKGDNVLAIPAGVLLGRGLHGLVVDGERLELDEAKWRWVESLMKGGGVVQTGLGGAMGIVRQTLPALMKAHANALYSALVPGDDGVQIREAAAVAFRGLVSELVPLATASAEAPVVKAYLASNGAVIDYLWSRKEWEVCDAYMQGRAAGAAVLPGHLLEDEVRRLAAMVISAGGRRWVAQHSPTGTDDEGELIAAQAWLAYAGHGYHEEQLQTLAAARCTWARELLNAVLQADASTAARLYQWVMLRKSSAEQNRS